MMLLRCLIALLACVLAVPLAARDVVGLYRGQAEVADRSAAELSRGAGAALSAVLIKLTGNRDATIARSGSGLVKRAARLLLQYAYETRPEDQQLMLKAEFDERALAEELAALDVAVWGKERPDSVVWLIIDRNAGRELISGDEPGLIGDAVLVRAAQRGIPVLLPLMDIDESQHLSYAGDWDGLSATALALSRRYGTPATLIGHLRQAVAGFWEAQWHLQLGATQRSWRQEGDIVDLMLEEAVDALADDLAAQYADPRMLAQAEALALSIYGVRSAADYARLLNYLNGLDTVSDLFISGIDNERVQVRFSARGGRGALAQSIEFGQVLAPRPGVVDAYQLLP